MMYKKAVDIYKSHLKRGKSPNQTLELQRSETDKKNIAKLYESLNKIFIDMSNLKIEQIPVARTSQKQIIKQSLTQLRQPRGYSATIDVNKRDKKIVSRQYESLEPKRAQTENVTLNKLLLKQQQQPRVPVKQKKTIWHSYLNESAQKQEHSRRVKSTLSISKEQYQMTENKNRSALSLHAKTQPDYASFTLSFSVRSRQGQLASNPNKTNQDTYICETNIAPDLHLFSVCDGHGQNGHYVSQFVKEHFPIVLQQDPNILTQLRDAIIKSTQIIANQVNHLQYDTQFSGTTMNAVLIQDGGRILCSNVGDSRAIVGRQVAKGKYKPFPLSVDHKPSLIREQQRIKQCGGRIDSYYDMDGNPIGPQRVWVNGANYPGLAMSRSLGDQVAASVGVSSIPEIFEYQLTVNDKFIILASDGVWEFIDNQTVVDIVGKFHLKKDIEGACDELLRVSNNLQHFIGR
ncbi:hypothetical protein pb186bvf_016345 [Paramecium bursaria]